MISPRVGHDIEVAVDDAASGPASGAGTGAGTGLVREAAAELYAGDPAGFIQRRGDLAAQARASGEGAAAKAITGLRKPTRSAWVVNRLVHSDPDVPSRLTALGDDLRDAGRSLDGRRLRELSQARRDLIAALTRRALAGAGQRDAPAALQEEVAGTLSAAVADPRVAAELAAGTLVRSVERSGFGFGPAENAGPDAGQDAGPDTGPDAGQDTGQDTGQDAGQDAGRDGDAPRYVARPARKRAGPERAGDQRVKRAGPDRAKREQAERERAEREAERARAEREQAERDRREAITAAEQAVQQAVQAADAAQSAERARAEAAGEIEQQLEDAQDLLAGAKRRSRAAAAALRDARRTLDRLRKSRPA